jgi:hypothetical protein
MHAPDEYEEIAARERSSHFGTGTRSGGIPPQDDTLVLIRKNNAKAQIQICE